MEEFVAHILKFVSLSADEISLLKQTLEKFILTTDLDPIHKELIKIRASQIDS